MDEYLPTRMSVAGSLLVAIGAAGCLTTGGSDLLEARLRVQADQIADYERRLQHTQGELDRSRREADLLRTQVAAGGKEALLPERADALVRASGIRFNTLMTRAVTTDDGTPAVKVVWAPHDEQGDLIKLAGEITVEANDLSRADDRQRIARLAIPADEALEHWRNGVFTTGYVVELPLDSEATGDVVLHARLATADGRRFDATHTVVVSDRAGSPRSAATQPVSIERVVEPSVEVPDPPPSLPVREPAEPTTEPQEPNPFLSNEPLRTSDVFPADEIPVYR